VAVLSAPFLLLGFTSLRWPWACLPVLVLIGACESAFAAMQNTLVLLQGPEASRGRAMGILSACIGTQPAGTLWIGFLAGGIGCRRPWRSTAWPRLSRCCPPPGRWPAGAGFDPLLTDFTKYPKFVAGYRDRRGGPGRCQSFPVAQEAS
jgi:hypothetical protein